MSSPSQSQPDLSKILELDAGSGRRKRRKRILLLLLILIVLMVATGLWKRVHNNDGPRYETQAAQKGNLTVLVTATGTLQPTNEVQVGSEVSGIIKDVNVDYNDKVKIGEVLARIDPSKLETQAAQAMAALDSAKAKVLQARATVSETRSKLAQLQHVRELSHGKVPSQTNLDTAQAAFDRAQADEASVKAAVSQAQATLDTYQTELGKAIIQSPINGIVLTRSIEPGQTVAASFQAPVLFTLAEDLRKMELHVDVDEADVGKVKEGQDATFQVDAYPNRTFQAKIIQTRFGSKTVDGVVTYETVLTVDNSDLSLRPGMTATADITVQRIEDTLLVPNAALRFSPPVQQTGKKPSRGLLGAMLPHFSRRESKPPENVTPDGKFKVWTLDNGQRVAVPITLGATNGTLTQVLTGNIKAGTKLVVDMTTPGSRG